MATIRAMHEDTTEAAIFARLWESPGAGFTTELAMHVLKLGFSERDQAHMHQLAAKNNTGTLSAAEEEALDNYVKVGDLLAILQSKARKWLKRSATPGNHHG